MLYDAWLNACRAMSAECCGKPTGIWNVSIPPDTPRRLNNGGVAFKPGLLPLLKAWLLSSVPRVFIGLLLKLVHRETVKYLKWLNRLREIGPADAQGFLNYMIEQEELQIEMMRLALADRYTEIAWCADRFFLKYNGVILDKRE